MSWVADSVRDWRVWALFAFLQVPGLRVVAKYLPAPLRSWTPLWLLATLLFYGALLHHRRVRGWCRSAGRGRVYVLAIVIMLSIFNAVVYPRVDSLKSQLRGSDEDDNLIQTSLRLVRGERPIYVPNYLGNPPTQEPGWALMVAPLTLSGTYFLLTPLALGALPLIVVAAQGSELAAALATLLPLSSPAFWELLVTGSDLFAIGVVFAGLTAAIFGWRDLGAAPRAACVALTIAAGTTRVVFAYPAALIGCFLWKRHRKGAVLLIALGTVIVALEILAWWPDRDQVTPISLLAKGVAMLGPIGLPVGAIATAAGTVFAIAQVDDSAASWMRGTWLGLAAMPARWRSRISRA